MKKVGSRRAIPARRKGGSRNQARLAKAQDAHRARIATALLLVLLASTFAIFMVYAVGPSNMGDDAAYAFSAHRVLMGQFNQASGDILSIRIMQIYPVAFFYWLLGVSSASSAMWDVFALLGTMAVLFYIGKELVNEYAGLLAALLIALSPIVSIYSTTMSDNPPMMFFVALAMLGVLYGERKSSRAWYAVAGIALIASSLVMPEGLIGLALVVLYLFVQVARKKISINGPVLGFAYGLAIALAVTFTFNYLNAGNPFITYTSTFSYFQTTTGTVISPANAYLGFYFSVMFPYNLVTALVSSVQSRSLAPLTALNNSTNTVGFLFYLLLPAAAYLLIARDRRAYLPLFWVVVGFLLLEFDPWHVSLFPFVYALQHRLDRHISLIAPAVALVIAFALAKIAEDKKGARRYAVAAFTLLVLAFVAYTSLGLNAYWQVRDSYESFDQVAIAGYLSALPNTTHVYYPNGFSFTEIYMQFANQSRFSVYDQMRNCTDIPKGAYVVMPKNNQVFGIPFTPNPLPYCPSWEEVYVPDSGGRYPASVTGTSAFSQAVLYYVPANSVS